MTASLEGRVAIVTGAGRGIGRATALSLASRGAYVVVNDLGASLEGDSSNEHPTAEVVDSIRAAGGRAIASTDSVAQWSSAQRIIEAALEEFGRIDFLVNNAGLFAAAPIWELDPELFDRVVRSHLHGTFHCMRAAVPHMKARGFGRIVNLVSRAGLVGMPGAAAYGAGKGGIFGLTNAASRDLAACGVSVNAVNPAATETRMVTTAIDQLSAQGEEERRRAKGLLDALQPPEQVASLITALLHDGCHGASRNEPARLNGQILFLERGRVGLFHPLEVNASQMTEGEWTVDSLREALTGFDPHPLGPIYDG
jgi:NAD(P)-dependent dehydrogenase (short-subunit alcohol dehydrogenase family)